MIHCLWSLQLYNSTGISLIVMFCSLTLLYIVLLVSVAKSHEQPHRRPSLRLGTVLCRLMQDLLGKKCIGGSTTTNYSRGKVKSVYAMNENIQAFSRVRSMMPVKSLVSFTRRSVLTHVECAVGLPLLILDKLFVVPRNVWPKESTA